MVLTSDNYSQTGYSMNSAYPPTGYPYSSPTGAGYNSSHFSHNQHQQMSMGNSYGRPNGHTYDNYNHNQGYNYQHQNQQNLSTYSAASMGFGAKPHPQMGYGHGHNSYGTGLNSYGNGHNSYGTGHAAFGAKLYSALKEVDD